MAYDRAIFEQTGFLGCARRSKVFEHRLVRLIANQRLRAPRALALLGVATAFMSGRHGAAQQVAAVRPRATRASSVHTSSAYSVTDLASSVQAIPRFATAAEPLALRGVTVIDVRDGRRRAAQTVVVIGNRVRWVGPMAAARVPKAARVVESRGKYLIPGLWDMHVHPWDDADVFYPLFVSYGVTGVRDAGSPTPLAALTRWKQEIAAGTRVGPRLFAAGPSINDCSQGAGMAHQVCISTSSEARLIVDFLVQAGADFIKPYSLSRELELALIAEARRIGVPIGGHSVAVPGLEASDSGMRSWIT